MNVWALIGEGTGILVIILTLIQITPIKINPWSYIAKCLGKAINKDVIEKVESLESKIDDLESKIDDERETMEEYKARQSRIRILRFGDEMRNQQKHTKEHFDDILTDIDVYEQFCSNHPNFRNGISVQTIKYIRNTYDKRLEKNDFL